MRVAVTGGSGFIGTNLLKTLISVGIDAESWDVARPRDPSHSPHWRSLDVSDRAAVRTAIERFRPSRIIHLAARTDLGGGADGYAVNVDGTRNIMEAASGIGSVERVVVASSRLVCRLGYIPSADDDYAPDSHYGASKASMEMLVRQSEGVPYTIVRPTSIWGPWFGTPYRDFFLAVACRRYVHPGRRRIPKSFGYVGNHVHQLLSLCAAPGRIVDGRTFYAADYAPLDVYEFAEKIAAAIGATPVRRAPLIVLRLLGATGDALQTAGLQPPLTRFRLRNLITPMVYDTAEISDVVGPLPFDTETGVAATVEWLKKARLV